MTVLFGVAGENLKGKLGDGTVTSRSEPVQVKGLDNVIAIAALENSTMALKSNGTVWTWGDDSYGQLGYGRILTSPSPVACILDSVYISGGQDCNGISPCYGSLQDACDDVIETTV